LQRWHLPQVNHVLDLRHASRMEQVEAALAALGLRLTVDVARGVIRPSRRSCSRRRNRRFKHQSLAQRNAQNYHARTGIC
jgi:hypothetical protein